MFTLPEYVSKILNTLHNAGFDSFVVGGAVRDMLLGGKPNDFDITTSCPPEKTATLFKKTVPTGIKHGTVTVIEDNKSVEVTTFRSDNGYTNHRKPDSVSFVGNLTEDLKRRDFTVNAIALSINGEIIDIFGGKEDIKNKIIRAVGNPSERFCEDALRIIRAFRFSAKLNFKIEPSTYKAAIDNAHLLEQISRERIFGEFTQILLTDHPEKVKPLVDGGGFKHLGIEKIESCKTLGHMPKKFDLRFYYFCRLANISAAVLCKSLKTDNKLFNYCKTMGILEETGVDTNIISIKKALKLADEQVLKDYFIIKDNTNACKAFEIIDKIINLGEPYKISHLKVDGNDILSLGCVDTAIGTVLNFLLEKVIEDPTLNNKTKLLLLATDFIKTQCTI